MTDIICTKPECQTTAGCQCRKPFGVNFTWGHVKDLQTAKVRELEAEILRLRSELSKAHELIEETAIPHEILKEKIRREALEQAALYHDDQVEKLLKVQRACVAAGMWVSSFDNNRIDVHRQSAAAIRAIAQQKGEQK